MAPRDNNCMRNRFLRPNLSYALEWKCSLWNKRKSYGNSDNFGRFFDHKHRRILQHYNSKAANSWPTLLQRLVTNNYRYRHHSNEWSQRVIFSMFFRLLGTWKLQLKWLHHINRSSYQLGFKWNSEWLQELGWWWWVLVGAYIWLRRHSISRLVWRILQFWYFSHLFTR